MCVQRPSSLLKNTLAIMVGRGGGGAANSGHTALLHNDCIPAASSAEALLRLPLSLCRRGYRILSIRCCSHVVAALKQ